MSAAVLRPAPNRPADLHYTPPRPGHRTRRLALVWAGLALALLAARAEGWRAVAAPILAVVALAAIVTGGRRLARRASARRAVESPARAAYRPGHRARPVVVHAGGAERLLTVVQGIRLLRALRRAAEAPGVWTARAVVVRLSDVPPVRVRVAELSLFTESLAAALERAARGLLRYWVRPEPAARVPRRKAVPGRLPV